MFSMLTQCLMAVAPLSRHWLAWNPNYGIEHFAVICGRHREVDSPRPSCDRTFIISDIVQYFGTTRHMARPRPRAGKTDGTP
jgi:hypothetical protein